MANVSIFAAISNAAQRKSMSPPSGSGGWWPVVREPFSGAWQRNMEVKQEDMLAFHAVFACVTLIASDISKLGINLHGVSADGIWVPVDKAEFSGPVDKPNQYQIRSQFIESWALSKMSRGNTYVLKERAGSRVKKLHVLHPDRVTPLISDSGDVYYELKTDDLAGITEEDARVVVPASEIIHDRFNCLYHPLVGLSPLYAASLAVLQGRHIQQNSATFFGNNSNPGGILTAPGAIADETAKRLKEHWDNNYSGSNAGKVAVLGDGLKYEAMATTATDAQLIEQLRWTAEVACSVYHVPPYKIGVGAVPSYNNVQALNQEYYSQCLQRLIKDMQSLLNAGLDVPAKMGFRFDLDALLMMDTQTQINTLKEGVGSALMKPNEGRKKLNLPPVEGGDTPYLQQQNYSLAALARRDAMDDPFGKQASAPTTADPVENEEDQARMMALILEKELSSVEYA